MKPLSPRGISVCIDPAHPADARAECGRDVAISRHGPVTAYLTGLPHFLEPGITTDDIARLWHDNPQHARETIDGAYLLLVIEPDNFHIVNDRVSPLTWHWLARDGKVYADTSLVRLLQASGQPIELDYKAIRYNLFTRGHHFDLCCAKGANRMRKAHYLDKALTPTRYYDFTQHFVQGATTEDYFEHLRDYLRRTMRGRKLAVLGSNGHDSRMIYTLLSEEADHFDAFTMRCDRYPEHEMARRFLKAMPRQNHELHVMHHSMVPSSPAYSPRRLARYTDLFLDMFDELTVNKEHFLFLEVLSHMKEGGYDALFTGAWGGNVRTINPVECVFPRDEPYEAVGTDETRRLFGVSDAHLLKEFTESKRNAAILDPRYERLGNGHLNYAQTLWEATGAMFIPLPMPTVRSMEIYRGIDRTKLPGVGGVNFYREFVAGLVPDAEPIPYDNGIAYAVPGERERWIAHCFDLAFVRRTMQETGIWHPDVLDMIMNHFARQRPPFRDAQDFLNLWAWTTVLTDRREAFHRSLQPMREHDAYLVANGHGALLRNLHWRFDQSRIATASLARVGDWRHPLHRAWHGINLKINRFRRTHPWMP